MMIRSVLFLLFIISSVSLYSSDAIIIHESLNAKAKNGDGIISLLRRYKLNSNNYNIEEFYRLNKLSKNSMLISGRSYELPIRVYQYNQKSIRSTINQNDWDKAVRIKNYNEWLLERGLRRTHYTTSKLLWVPYHELNLNSTIVKEDISDDIIVSNKSSTNKLFGKKHENILIKDQQLAGRVYYLISGHGGIDPGAVCDDCSSTLCEDEYAYDVTLRLAKRLMEHGATVEVVIQDKSDGIRDDRYLKCDHSEIMANGEKLHRKQINRLNQRAHYVNRMYRKHLKSGVKEQMMISIHVDSRSKSSKQDVFFNYYPDSKSSKKLAGDIMTTFEQKYAEHQKGRNYKGYINARNLHVLRVTQPKAVLIELANIKNQFDHKRILMPDNREALAKWIYEGITKRVKKIRSDQIVASS